MRLHLRPAALAAAVALFVAAPAGAADPKPADTALGKAPADAAYFRSALRLGETVETIGKSRAWRELWNEPQVQQLWERAKAEFAAGEGPFAAAQKFLADPANAELPALAADALSNEVFVYAGAGIGDAVALMQEVQGGMQFGRAFGRFFGQGGEDKATAQARAALQALAENPDRIKAPELVIGFKVSDPAKVAAQLKRLDPVLADALEETPLKGRSKRVKVGGDEFLVLNLDGSLVPWDMLPLAQFEEKEGEFAPLLDRLKKLTLTVAVGVREGYLLVAVGPSAEHLAKFGGAGPKLAGRPEFKPLEKVAGKPLTAIGYTSAALRKATATSPEDVAGLADGLKSLLELAELTEETRKAIEKDLGAAGKALAGRVVEPGAGVEVSVRTARGWETFEYDTTPAGEAAAKPLTVLNHLGGDPLLAVVWRSGTTPEDYRAAVNWATVAAGHAQQVVREKFPDVAPTVDNVVKEFRPLLDELDEITERLWLPALADGQEAVVLDAKWSSKKWQAMMPEADKPLPLPEFGVVVGVSDRVKLEQAAGRYWALGDKMIAKARELAPPDSIPPFSLPEPKVERAKGRALARFPLPEEWGLDKQVEPTAGASDKFGVFAFSAAHAGRLLDETPLKVELAPFADPERPLQSAALVNWGGLVEMTGPWAEFVFGPNGRGENPEALDMAKKSIRLLGVFRRYGTATYREGGATVTHSEAVFRDVPPGRD
ncbi:MAG: hypothetical protein K2X82_11035 [Gemmataceae bacterium]|nr:hypothetical protein [Gemmataceae bacterium]